MLLVDFQIHHKAKNEATQGSRFMVSWYGFYRTDFLLPFGDISAMFPWSSSRGIIYWNFSPLNRC